MPATPDDAASAAAPSFDDGQRKLQRYAQLSARKVKAEAELAEAIAPLKAAADKKIAPIVAQLDQLKIFLEGWWAIHGESLTKSKKKSAELAGCVLGTRVGPKRLAYTLGDDAAAIAALLKKRLVTLLRRSPTLDRVAITKRLEAEPDGDVAKLGFKIEPGIDAFFVEPATRTGRKA